VTPITAATLAIEHVDNSSPPAFTLTRYPNTKSAAPVPIASPYEFPVEGQSGANLMHELRWYLERFLDYPFDPELAHAGRVLDALQDWGTQAFNALFDRRDVGEWLAQSGVVQVRGDDPRILSWPWEALFDPQHSYLAHDRRVERRLNHISDPAPLPALPNDRVNILLVVARPYKADVRYRSIARPLVELIQSRNLPAHVDVLRPPTFDQLRAHLRAHPGYYHVLHFDGHGAYGGLGDEPGGYSPHTMQGPQGRLVFETEDGRPDLKSAADLSTLLRDYAVPAVVLNACQSAMLGETAGDPFSSVATALLKSGMRSLPAEIREHREPYGFIGRDSAILAMERALHRQAPAILIQGLGGVGKTTLARGFLRWLDDTGGLDGALWFDFRDIHTADYVTNRVGQAFYGENFGIAKDKLQLLAGALAESRVLIVWDNFESAAANLGASGHAELGSFLEAIRGGRGNGNHCGSSFAGLGPEVKGVYT
jgi:hypothetical protein